MRHVAVNDDNKRLLREGGALPLLERALFKTSKRNGGKGGDAADLCIATLLLMSFEGGSREWVEGKGGVFWGCVREAGDRGCSDAQGIMFACRNSPGLTEVSPPPMYEVLSTRDAPWCVAVIALPSSTGPGRVCHVRRGARRTSCLMPGPRTCLNTLPAA